MKSIKKQEQANSRTLQQLWNLKNQRGHKDKWVYYVFESRVLKDRGTVEQKNKKYGLDAASESDLKDAILRTYKNFIKNL